MPTEARRPETSRDAEFKAEIVALIPFLRAFARTLCGDAAQGDDISQEALLKAWKARGSFKPGTNFKAWAFKILRNHFYSERRRAWRQVAWNPEKAERTLTSVSDVVSTIALDELRRALARLPDVQRDAIVLVGAGGFSYGEAADICGCAVGTIKSRVSRARVALESILEDGDMAPPGSDGISAFGAMDAIHDSVRRIASKSAARREAEPGGGGEAIVSRG